MIGWLQGREANSMVGGQRPAVVLVLAIAVTVGLTMALKSHNLRTLAASLLNSQGIWKVIALLFALLNLKSLPLMWHVSLVPNPFLPLHL